MDVRNAVRALPYADALRCLQGRQAACRYLVVLSSFGRREFGGKFGEPHTDFVFPISPCSPLDPLGVPVRRWTPLGSLFLQRSPSRRDLRPGRRQRFPAHCLSPPFSGFRPPVSGFSVPRIPLRDLCDLCGETIPPACHGVVPARRDGGRARQLVTTSLWQTRTRYLTQGRFLFPVAAQSALDIFRQRYPVVRGQLLQEIVFCHL